MWPLSITFCLVILIGLLVMTYFDRAKISWKIIPTCFLLKLILSLSRWSDRPCWCLGRDRLQSTRSDRTPFAWILRGSCPNFSMVSIDIWMAKVNNIVLAGEYWQGILLHHLIRMSPYSSSKNSPGYFSLGIPWLQQLRTLCGQSIDTRRGVSSQLIVLVDLEM